MSTATGIPAVPDVGKGEEFGDDTAEAALAAQATAEQRARPGSGARLLAKAIGGFASWTPGSSG